MELEVRVRLITVLALTASFWSCTSPGTLNENAEHLRVSVASRLGSAANRCLQADIKALPCRTLSDNEDLKASSTRQQIQFKYIERNYYEAFRPAVLEALLGPVGFFALRESSDSEIMATQARHELNWILKKMKKKAVDEKLSRCHSVCLLQCFTSQAIRYEASLAELDPLSSNPADRGPYHAAGWGEGVCRNYATLAEEMDKKLGNEIESLVTASGTHVVVAYYDQGKRYAVDPQHNPLRMGMCSRYRP